MNFDLTAPCKDCPFRSDVRPYLNKHRVREIIASITVQQGTFSCHKTNEHDDEGEAIETGKSQHCAGAAILLERMGRPNQMMRIAERLGMYDHTKLKMDSPVFDTPAKMIAAQPSR